MSIVNLDLLPVTARIGAEVRGINLSGVIHGDTFESLRQALFKHKVLFFRNQYHIDDQAQEGFARRWGELAPPTAAPLRDDADFLMELDSNYNGGANAWHSDVTFDVAYPQASVLRVVAIPAVGGDTVWANTATAYTDLPEGLRKLADTLWALHTNDYGHAATRLDPTDESLRHYRDVFTSIIYETEHPIVRVHPETGERTLVLGQFVKKLLDFTAGDSERLLSILQSHVTRLENTMRWRWAVGDVAIWDNRATQHYTINDYGDQHPIVRRLSIAGDVPISVDGRRSLARVVAARSGPELATAANLVAVKNQYEDTHIVLPRL
ncbi:TauD/TfdA family dioxygenase [Glaciimonas sp. CA11.2]|uniref:TauD/TfdA dioxygenase family protein n=1 Tax=Glaciimonas sp. CA11.2 TaxID=3048601 RepID=UPI002AB41F1F|nr:TauD/TfdA family dioxygenase [Glaciimonas sp. CA11.2]MDY7547352.1 TauD/TfdA family dioxygenase [Glaciimonas sp. CA11.2]MEB0162939.1 TauD/TfdA family dioxygenase [Glaciimonas sp. CA11.2]